MLDALLQAVVDAPQDEARHHVLADWLEEHDDPRRAELLRLHRRLLATCCEPDEYPERAAWQARVVELIGLGVRPCVPQRTLDLGGGVSMTFSFVPPGSFLMGSPPQEGWPADERQHRVKLTRGFWMGVYPVTQAQWRAVTGGNPSGFEGDDRPVETVSWDDCVAFCRRLGEGFRLPTEAEWEYACRAGTTTTYYTGDGTDAMGRAGCVGEKVTSPVGRLEPNAWGLYDMHGNVLEWCRDQYEGSPHRVLRGGCWSGDADSCRSACRDSDPSDIREVDLGCRVVLCPDGEGP